MSEAQAFITFPSFLECFSLSRYESEVGVATRKDGFESSWRNIIQYLLRSYAKPKHRTEAILKLRVTRQKIGEIEQEFFCRLNDDVRMCGHVHDSSNSSFKDSNMILADWFNHTKIVIGVPSSYTLFDRHVMQKMRFAHGTLQSRRHT